jgi:hypothetical protein
MVNTEPPAWMTDACQAGIEIKEQIERSEDMRYLFHNRLYTEKTNCLKLKSVR